MTLIVLNTILLMMKVNIGTWIKKNRKANFTSNFDLQYYQQPIMMGVYLHYMNTVFTGCFTVECFMKLFAMGFRVRL